MYFDKLDYIINKYKNTYHRTIKIKSVDVKPSMHVDFNKENNKEGPTFTVGDHVRISEKKFFVKVSIPNWSEEVLVITKVKNTVPWTYVISALNGKEIVGMFYPKNCEKQI